MVEIIECADLMGQSKNDFLNKGVAIKKRSSGGGGLVGGLAKVAISAAKTGAIGWGGDYDSLPRAKMWIQFADPTELMRVAELLGVKAINKRKSDYVFASEGTIYYAKG
ncbi:MAG: hypothetical protein ACTSUE_18175 [Promethearchaeota archaeon]